MNSHWITNNFLDIFSNCSEPAPYSILINLNSSTHSLHIRISQSPITRQVTHRIFLSSISAIA